MIITQNGEAKVMVQHIVSLEKTQETQALIEILTLGERNIAEGKYRPAKEAFADLRTRLNAHKTAK